MANLAYQLHIYFAFCKGQLEHVSPYEIRRGDGGSTPVLCM